MTICPEQQRCWTADFLPVSGQNPNRERTKGESGRTPLIYDWWERTKRSCGDEYESARLGRSSIMPAGANFRSCVAQKWIREIEGKYLSENRGVLITGNGVSAQIGEWMGSISSTGWLFWCGNLSVIYEENLRWSGEVYSSYRAGVTRSRGGKIKEIKLFLQTFKRANCNNNIVNPDQV